MTEARIAVIGLGTAGAMALWRLARRGVAVDGYEQFGVGHPRGASAGQTRRFSAVSQSDPQNTPLALEAITLWRELEAESGRQLLHLNGGLVIGPEGSPSLQAAKASAADYQLEHEVLGADELRRSYPQHLVRDEDEAVHDSVSGFLRPEAAIVSAVQQALRHGARVHEQAEVTEIAPDGAGVRVEVGGATRRYDAVVVAPGAWASRLVPGPGGQVAARKLFQAWFVPAELADYHPDRFPVFERVGDVQCYGFPSVDGATVKVGVYTVDHPLVADPDEPGPGIDEGRVALLRETVSTYLPGLHPELVMTTQHLEGYSPDKHAILGGVAPGVVAACGFSGSGFKFAPVIGDVAASLAAGTADDRDITHWSPERFSQD